MRNLAEYPITLDEKIEALDWAIDKANEEAGESCGDIRPVALDEMKRELEFFRTAMGATLTFRD